MNKKETAHTPRSGQRTILAVGLGLFLVVVGLYWQTTSFEFNLYDDPLLVYENPNLLKGVSLERIGWALTSLDIGWQPITWISHMVDLQLFGQRAGLHHLVNLLLHALNTLLLFFLLRRLTGRLWRSALVAILFGIHPLHVESVAWITERRDLLSGLFLILTIGAYAAWVEKKSFAGYLLVCVLFAAGLMCKPILVTLPILLLFLDVWPLGRLPLSTPADLVRQWQKVGWLLLEKIPLFALTIGSCLITIIGEQRLGTIGTMEKYTLLMRIKTVLVGYVSYLLKTFWPVNLIPYYPYDFNISDSTAIGCLLILVAITILCLWSLKSSSYLAVGWFWYLISLVPVIGVVQQDMIAMADRYTYIPLVGIFIMVAWGGAALVERLRFRPAIIGMAVGLILVVLWGTCFKHIRHWRNAETLFQYTLTVDPDNERAYFVLGSVYMDKKDFDKALEHYFKAQELNPSYNETYAHIGNVYDQMGELDLAAHYYTQALQNDPTYGEIYVHLGMIRSLQGDNVAAEQLFGAILEMQPDNIGARMNLGFTYFLEKNFPQAAQQFEQVIAIDPQAAAPHNGLGIVRMQQGRIDEAISNFQTALRLNPEFTFARDNLRDAMGLKENMDPQK